MAALYAQVGSAPFDNSNNDADVVLRSEDGTDFYVHQNILRIASPLFGDMFNLPQTTRRPDDGVNSTDGRLLLPVVPVSEDAHILDGLLRLCYPVEAPERTQVHELTALLKATIKYELRGSEAALKSELKYFCITSPLDGYAKAWRHGRALEEFVKLAAEQFCAPLSPSQLSQRRFSIDTYTSHMDGITADAYYRLLDYRNGLHAGNQKVFSKRLNSRLWYGTSYLQFYLNDDSQFSMVPQMTLLVIRIC